MIFSVFLIIYYTKIKDGINYLQRWNEVHVTKYMKNYVYKIVVNNGKLPRFHTRIMQLWMD